MRINHLSPSSHKPDYTHRRYSCIPALWPVCLGFEAEENARQNWEHTLNFIGEAYRINHELSPVWTTQNQIMLDLDTMYLRDFSTGSQNLPVLLDAPYAGHSATIVDFAPGQSLVKAFLDNGHPQVFVTDWKSATEEMKDFTIDTYLEALNLAIDELGGEVVLVGVCQGGWLSAALAARFPKKVKALILAGAPIDTQAGNGVIKKLTRDLSMSNYKALVKRGNGRLLGQFMLQAWKGMHPDQQYIEKYIDLFLHLDDPHYVKRTETFARWYEYPLDLPGAFYLQVVQQLFKENLLARGEFMALGKKINLKAITVPTYLLAGKSDDITPPEQVLAATHLIGTPPSHIAQKIVPGGHIGLFMGHKNIHEVWPEIAKWLAGMTD